MTTPNGQHPQDPVDAGEHSASTVLALDGWGPLLPETAMNGTADEPVEEEVTDIASVESAPTTWHSGLQFELPSVSIPPLRPGARMLAPAAAIGLVLGVAVGGALRWWRRQQMIAATPAPPPSKLATARRALALALDPTLAEPCPPQSPLERLLRPRR